MTLPVSEAAPFCRVVVVTGDVGVRHRLESSISDEWTSLRSVSLVTELEAIASEPDVVLLDASHRDTASMRMILRLRRRWPGVTMIALNVTSESAACELLGWGVDDVIELRCSAAYAAARIGAATRRARTANAAVRRQIGDVIYDRASRRVWCGGVEVDFAPRELALLDCLWSRAGETVRQESLYDFVWSDEVEGEHSNRVEVYISYLRRKLRQSNGVAIETMRGAGYRLVRLARKSRSA